MPALCLLLDGELLATVNTKGYDVVSVHVHGTRTDVEFATLEMSGGIYPGNGESTHLVWVNHRELPPSQRVEVRFQEKGETHPRGKTIEELFPEETEGEEPVEFKPTEAMVAELRSKPTLRSGYELQFAGTSGATFSGRTAPSDHGFSFTVVWNSHRPNRASLSLHGYTIDELESRAPMRDFVREYIEAPHSAALRVDA